MPSIGLILVLSSALLSADAQTPVNSGAALVQDFEKRVDEYLKSRKSVEAGLPRLKQTPSQEEIAQHERELAKAIRSQRAAARQGDIFTSEISAEFRRLIGITMQGQDAARIKQSLRSAEPVRLQLAVNDSYPPSVPLQSTPPTLLLNLPKLAPDLDYRVVGHSLVLRDVKANLVVDFIPSVIP